MAPSKQRGTEVLVNCAKANRVFAESARRHS